MNLNFQTQADAAAAVHNRSHFDYRPATRWMSAVLWVAAL